MILCLNMFFDFQACSERYAFSKKLVLLKGCRGPGGLGKMRETRRIHFHHSWYLTYVSLDVLLWVKDLALLDFNKSSYLSLSLYIYIHPQYIFVELIWFPDVLLSISTEMYRKQWKTKGNLYILKKPIDFLRFFYIFLQKASISLGFSNFSNWFLRNNWKT